MARSFGPGTMPPTQSEALVYEAVPFCQAVSVALAASPRTATAAAIILEATTVGIRRSAEGVGLILFFIGVEQASSFQSRMEGVRQIASDSTYGLCCNHKPASMCVSCGMKWPQAQTAHLVVLETGFP